MSEFELDDDIREDIIRDAEDEMRDLRKRIAKQSEQLRDYEAALEKIVNPPDDVELNDWAMVGKWSRTVARETLAKWKQ